MIEGVIREGQREDVAVLDGDMRIETRVENVRAGAVEHQPPGWITRFPMTAMKAYGSSAAISAAVSFAWFLFIVRPHFLSHDGPSPRLIAVD